MEKKWVKSACFILIASRQCFSDGQVVYWPRTTLKDRFKFSSPMGREA